MCDLDEVVDLGIVITQGTTRKHYTRKVKYHCISCGTWVEAQKAAYTKFGRRKCKACASTFNGPTIAAAHKLTAADSFVNKVYVKFGDVIDCSNSTYVDQHTNITAFCNIHQEYFERTPHSILKGYACPICGAERKDYAKRRNLQDPAMVYFIYFYDIGLWKLGVTTTSIARRYSNEPEKYTTIFMLPVETAEIAYSIEEQLLKDFSEFKYTGNNVLKSGNSECFISDISVHLLEAMTSKHIIKGI